jgi:hypothetical protein
VRPISNERPECLVSENIGQSERAGGSDGEMMLLKNDLGQSSHRWHHMSSRYTFLFYFHGFA